MEKTSKRERFTCEHLMVTEDVLKKIKGFTPKKPQGAGVVNYLKKAALNEEHDMMQRTYLIFDNEYDELAAFFSLKAGTAAYDESDNPDSPTGFILVPGIEISNFAINGTYTKNHPEITHFGEYVFTRMVMPTVIQATEIVGARFAFIFALPEQNLINLYSTVYGFKEPPKEIESKLNETIKPDYDTRCKFMYLSIYDYIRGIK